MELRHIRIFAFWQALHYLKPILASLRVNTSKATWCIAAKLISFSALLAHPTHQACAFMSNFWMTRTALPLPAIERTHPFDCNQTTAFDR
jgi:hypothetical protein